MIETTTSHDMTPQFKIQEDEKTRSPLAVHTKNISVKFPGNSVALKFRDLSIQPGSRALIFGASGSGKTTLLHTLAGLLPPYTGQVTLGEFDLYKAPEHARSSFRRQHIGIIFQTLNLLEYLTVEENVRLALLSSDPQAVNEALQRVHIENLAHRMAPELSLGQRQRVAAARILAQKPTLILADEPTSSLDDFHAEAVMDALWDVSENATLIMVSHDRRFYDRFSERHSIHEVLKK